MSQSNMIGGNGYHNINFYLKYEFFYIYFKKFYDFTIRVYLIFSVKIIILTTLMDFHEKRGKLEILSLANKSLATRIQKK